MAKPLVSDELWAIIEPLLPPKPAQPKGGRPPVPDRAALAGIIFVLKTGIPWEYLPAGDGLRLRHDLLAAAARLAGGRASGDRCTACSCSAWRTPGGSTGAGPALDGARVPAKGGRRGRARTRSTGASRGRTTIW